MKEKKAFLGVAWGCLSLELLRNVVDLKSRRCRKLKRGEKGVSPYTGYVNQPARGLLLVVPFVVVGMSAYCTGAFENLRKV